MNRRHFSGYTVGGMAIALLGVAAPASAIEIKWTDWANATTGQVDGTATSLGETISVTYSGTFAFVQTGTGTDYFTPSSPYTDNAVVDNRPPAAEMVALSGGDTALTHTVSFSEPVVDPVMAIVSLGQPAQTITYNFGDETFDILSSGTGYWGGAEPDSLFQITPSILTGTEGHGVIQFSGTYSEITWTVPAYEYWHGFTLGFELLESQTPVPVPAAAWLLGTGLLGLIGAARGDRGAKRNLLTTL